MKFKDYFYEICMLFKYASERTGSNQNKFRINTFTSVAIKDPLFKVGDLKKLVKMLEDDDLLKYIKTSYVLTDEALKLVDKLRSVKFNHLIA